MEGKMSRVKAILAAGCTALALGGMFATSAQAGESTGRWRDGSYATPYGVARPYPTYGHRHYYRHGYNNDYRHGYNNGGAVAAGVVGGLALGALAARPAYPGYYAAPVYSGPPCYTVRRRFVDDWGRTFIRRERVCE
jgi:hypothetical protein